MAYPPVVQPPTTTEPSPYITSITQAYADAGRPPLPESPSDSGSEHASDEDSSQQRLAQAGRANSEGLLEIPHWNPNHAAPIGYEARERTPEPTEEELAAKDHDIVLSARRRQALPPERFREMNVPKTKSKYQLALRVRALRNQIRVAHGIIEVGLVKLLDEFEWDVNKAAAAWRAREERLRRSKPDKPLFEELDVRRGYRGLDPLRGGHRASVGESRVAALAALAVRLNQNPVAPGVPRRETNATMVQFMQRCCWDIDAAEREWMERAGDVEEFQKASERLRSRAPTQLQQDERLRDFVSITSTDSIEAARQFLQARNWDFAAGVDGWLELGFLPMVIDRYRENNGFRTISVETMPDNVGMDQRKRKRHESRRSVQRSLDATPLAPFRVPGFAKTTTPPPVSNGDQPDYQKKAKRDTQDGFILDYDPSPKEIANSACPDPTKLRVEAIRHGEYTFMWNTPGKKSTAEDHLRFVDTPNPDEDEGSDFERAEFDWNSKAHVSALNVGLNQKIKSIEGRRRKEKSVPFHWFENRWLWDWMAEKYEKFCDENAAAGVRQEDLPRFVVAEPEKLVLTTEFNKVFNGKTVVDGVRLGEEPRPFRGRGALNTQRTRVMEIARDFGLTYSPVGKDVGIEPAEERGGKGRYLFKELGGDDVGDEKEQGGFHVGTCDPTEGEAIDDGEDAVSQAVVGDVEAHTDDIQRDADDDEVKESEGGADEAAIDADDEMDGDEQIVVSPMTTAKGVAANKVKKRGRVSKQTPAQGVEESRKRKRSPQQGVERAGFLVELARMTMESSEGRKI